MVVSFRGVLVFFVVFLCSVSSCVFFLSLGILGGDHPRTYKWIIKPVVCYKSPKEVGLLWDSLPNGRTP